MPAMTAQTTITTAILTPDGIKPTAYQVTSLDDAAKHEPIGVYTVARTYRRIYGLKLAAHMDRLEESAHLLGIDTTLDRQAIRAALRQIIDQAGYPESRYRITVPADNPDTIYFSVEPLREVPRELRDTGVKMQTVRAKRSNPSAKDTRWMDARVPLKAQLREGIYEGLLVDEHGIILEGLTSNFYAILDGELRTAGSEVLNGISRRIVVTVAPSIIPLREEPVAVEDIPRLTEAFMTSSARGVIPVVKIDGQAINGGMPGKITRAITQQYDAWSDSNLEPI
jgi:branched-chain amino acid aminotransferase